MKPEAGYHLLGRLSLIFEERIERTEGEMRSAELRALGLSESKAARGARLLDTPGKNVSLMPRG
jgi:hypothetical protein